MRRVLLNQRRYEEADQKLLGAANCKVSAWPRIFLHKERSKETYYSLAEESTCVCAASC